MSDRALSALGIGALVVAILACSAAGQQLPSTATMNTDCFNANPPLISLHVTLDPQQSQELAAQLKQFAMLHDYTYDLAVYSADGQDFSVHMDGPGLLVVAASPFTRGEFRIGFYNRNCDHPTKAADLQDESQDLLRLLEEIPGIEIVESTNP